MNFLFPERKGGSKAKMGVEIVGEAKKRYNTGVPRRLCPKYNWKTSVHMCALES